MQAELNGETRPVLRHRRGVMWCPYCDRSSQDKGGEQYCDGCRAKFTDAVIEPAPRRRRRANHQEEVINLEAGDAIETLGESQVT
jgi:hypothetical protein